MYPIINLMSLYARQFILPNPYVNIIKNQTYSDIFNIFVGGSILYVLSYTLVGIIYRKGIDSPTFGSFLYLLFHIFFTLFITYITYFIGNMKIAIIVILSVYVMLFMLLNHISNKRYGVQF